MLLFVYHGGVMLQKMVITVLLLLSILALTQILPLQLLLQLYYYGYYYYKYTMVCTTIHSAMFTNTSSEYIISTNKRYHIGKLLEKWNMENIGTKSTNMNYIMLLPSSGQVSAPAGLS